MLLRSVMGLVLGAAIGGAVGHFLRGMGGACPLPCNPIGGIITGSIIGLLIASRPVERTVLNPSENMTEITSLSEFESTLSKNNLVLVDFYADWCGPCRAIKPMIHELADKYVGKVAFVGVNIDKARDVAGKQGVSSIPDVRLYAGGKEADRFVGSRPRDMYEKAIEMLISSSTETEPNDGETKNN